jgi:hypothetical protein
MSLESHLSWNYLFFGLGHRRHIVWRDLLTCTVAARCRPARRIQAAPALDRLCCYWQWPKGNTTEQTITCDLVGMKFHGYGGAILVDADGPGMVRTAKKKMTAYFRSCGYAIF